MLVCIKHKIKFQRVFKKPTLKSELLNYIYFSPYQCILPIFDMCMKIYFYTKSNKNVKKAINMKLFTALS